MAFKKKKNINVFNNAVVQIKYWPFYFRRKLCAPNTKRPNIQK